MTTHHTAWDGWVEINPIFEVKLLCDSGWDWRGSNSFYMKEVAYPVREIVKGCFDHEI